jgi:methionine sulfoxide reductase heme-binding subunit
VTEAYWYAARGTGLMSLVLLTAVVALGIATKSGRPLPGLPRFAIVAVHRNASLLAVALLAVHVGTLLLDPYAQVRLLDVVVPFTTAYRPVWVGLGTIALDLLAAVIVTSLLRHRMGAGPWRAVHWLAYAAWPAAVLHGLKSGSDAGQTWFLAVTLTCVAAIAAALGWRLSEHFTEFGRARRTGSVSAPYEGAPR